MRNIYKTLCHAILYEYIKIKCSNLYTYKLFNYSCHKYHIKLITNGTTYTLTQLHPCLHSKFAQYRQVGSNAQKVVVLDNICIHICYYHTAHSGNLYHISHIAMLASKLAVVHSKCSTLLE